VNRLACSRYSGPPARDVNHRSARDPHRVGAANVSHDWMYCREVGHDMGAALASCRSEF
jgi:hypothetical protein